MSFISASDAKRPKQHGISCEERSVSKGIEKSIQKQRVGFSKHTSMLYLPFLYMRSVWENQRTYNSTPFCPMIQLPGISQKSLVQTDSVHYHSPLHKRAIVRVRNLAPFNSSSRNEEKAMQHLTSMVYDIMI